MVESVNGSNRRAVIVGEGRTDLQGHRDGQEETTIHGGVQEPGGARGTAGARQRAGDRCAARASSHPGHRVAAAAARCGSRGICQGRREAGPRARSEDSRPAREDRRTYRRARYFQRGAQSDAEESSSSATTTTSPVTAASLVEGESSIGIPAGRCFLPTHYRVAPGTVSCPQKAQTRHNELCFAAAHLVCALPPVQRCERGLPRASRHHSRPWIKGVGGTSLVRGERGVQAGRVVQEWRIWASAARICGCDG